MSEFSTTHLARWSREVMDKVDFYHEFLKEQHALAVEGRGDPSVVDKDAGDLELAVQAILMAFMGRQ